MIDYGRQRSSLKPEEMDIDDFSVWIYSDIQEITENVGEDNEFVGFEFNMIQYDKNEFIQKQAETNVALESEITSTQVALAEVYEMITT